MFLKVELINETPHKYLNTSAKQIKHKYKISYLKKYIKNSEILNNFDNLHAALVTPDYDIIPDAKKLTPAYVVFDNYEVILKWNRSLRFALAVCTLKSKFKNAIKYILYLIFYLYLLVNIILQILILRTSLKRQIIVKKRN